MSGRKKPPGYRDILRMAARDAATRAHNSRPLPGSRHTDEDAAFKRGARWAFDVMAQELGHIADGLFANEYDRRQAFARWLREKGWEG